MRAASHAMLESEYAFGEAAKTSIRGAFLRYLAGDSWVLNPGPVSGRALYESSKDSKNTLTWYPAIADVAPSGDLGFTTGPYIFTSAAGAPFYGQFLTIWKRDAQCDWRVQFDGGVSHPAPAVIEPKLLPGQAPISAAEAPPAKLAADDAAGRTLGKFQDTAQQDGIAAALRTYARNGDFLFYTDGQSPLGIAAANAYFDARASAGTWKEFARGRSADSAMMYSIGEFTESVKHGTHAYVQIWQYDPKVANWGLRILLLNPLPPPKEKS